MIIGANHSFVRDIAAELGYLICNSVMLLNCDQAVLGGEYLAFAGDMLPLINERTGSKELA
jgi:hypothetical protein